MSTFRGWPPAAIDLYRRLEQENTRTFWLEHKATYDQDVRAPFDALSDLVASEFSPLGLLNRETWVQQGQDPVQDQLLNVVGEGEDGEGYYVGISAQGLAVGAGFWIMANDQLDRIGGPSTTSTPAPSWPRSSPTAAKEAQPASRAMR